MTLRRCRHAWMFLLGAFVHGEPASAIWPFDRPSYPDPATDLSGAAAEILSQAIRIPTVNPPGDELLLAKYLASVLRKVKPAEHDERVLAALREAAPPVV